MNVERVPFRSVAEFLSGGTPSKGRADFWAGPIPWVSPKDMHGPRIKDAEDHISDEAVSASATRCVDPGTILAVARSGILAKRWPIAIADATVAFNQDIKAIVVQRARVDPEYAYWWLRSIEDDVVQRGVKKGATVHSLFSNFVEELAFPLSPLDEQRRIVDILNRAERIRRLRDAAAATRRALIPALFLEMFGDPIENPMGWDVRPLGEALRACDYGSSTKASETGEGLPLIRMGNVDVQGHLETGDLKYVELSEVDHAKYGLEAGDIIFNRTNSKELVGKTGLWDGRFAAVLASYFIRLRVKTDMVAPVFVWAYFNTPAMKKKLYATARGAIGQANINAKELCAFTLPLPPLEKQQQFGDLVESIIVGGTIADTAATTATALGAALKSRLFGEAA